jgi:O-antigen/teichoic acid export membrane protein
MSVADSIPSLTSGRRLAKSTIWNLLGQLLPMPVGLIAVPPLIRALGVDRFGMLSLAWVIVGYFSLFDLGLGRALTKLVADKLGGKDEHTIAPLVWTSLFLLLLLGVVGGVIGLALSPWLVYSALKVPPALQAEALRSFQLLAVSIPIVTVTSGLRGILEALQRFRVLSFIRIPSSIFSFAGPLLVLPFSHRLVPVVALLLAGRLLAALAHVVACLGALPALAHSPVWQREFVNPLLRFGGWMTVSNIVGPLMVYADRFMIGAVLSVSAVAYYTTPFDLVFRLTFIPQGVAGVLFPAFATSLAGNPERTSLLVSRGVKYIYLAMAPIILITIAFAPEGLALWLGPSFAAHSAPVLRWLAVGVFLNSVACVPFALIQSAGRPSLTAKLHLFELPLYLVFVWFFASWKGIEGVALAWTARVLVDTVLLFFFARRLLQQPARGFLLKLAAAMSASLLLCYVTTVPAGLAGKTALTLMALLVLLLGAFLRMAPDERRLIGRLRGA